MVVGNLNVNLLTSPEIEFKYSRALKKYIYVVAAICILLASGYTNKGSAQTIKILAGSTLNGAINGVGLGGAVMGLQNSDDFAPVRIGLGAGTLFGIGTGFYDVSQVSKGEQFYISGTFNDGTNTSIIVLLDTFYGAAAGAIIGSSITLIANKPVVDALQYGSSAGAWVGFGFGLIDAFALSKGPGDFSASSTANHETEGMINYTSKDKSVGIGLINPSVASFTRLETKRLERTVGFNMELVNLNFRF